jgi:hypothetical protein
VHSATRPENFLSDNDKGGESISPKQKDRTTTNFKFLKKFTNGIDIFHIGITTFKNWYLKPS